MSLISRVALHCLLAGCLLIAPAQAADPMEGIGPTGEIKTIGSEFQFTEGPASDGQGNMYFTDIPANLIYRLAADGKFAPARDPSNHTNGLMFTGAGQLLCCEMDGALVAFDLKTNTRTVLTDKYNDTRYNAPNDLVIDSRGGVYFTDPRFRAPEPWPQGVEAVYYRDPAGKVTRLADDLKAPNGVILSPDEKTLYVIPSMQKEMMAYTVAADGSVSEPRVFCTLQQPEGKDNTGGDGLTVDTNGNLYITSALGIQVFTPKGKLLGIISFPQQPANVSFGGKDGKTLYVTARTGVYSVPMEAQGHVFPGKLKSE